MVEEKSGGIGTGLRIPQSGSVSFLGCRRSAPEELYCRAELRAQGAPRRKLPLINHLQPRSAPVNPTASGCAQYFNSGRIDSFPFLRGLQGAGPVFSAAIAAACLWPARFSFCLYPGSLISRESNCTCLSSWHCSDLLQGKHRPFWIVRMV